MFLINKPNGYVSQNRKEILMVVQEFYCEKYHSDVQPQPEERTEIKETKREINKRGR